MAIQEKWGKRELECQIKSALFERVVLNPPKVSALLKQTHPEALTIFKDSYLLDFLHLSENHSEPDLHKGLLVIALLENRMNNQLLVCYFVRAKILRLSPTLIAEYQTRLPDKKLLEQKLHEFYFMNLMHEEED